MNNLILRSDSYKHSHPALFPPGVTGLSAYIEARKPDLKVMLFGLQMYLTKLTDNFLPILPEDVDEAEDFLKRHGEPFDRTKWDYLIKEYDCGYNLPITIRAVPEGLAIPSLNPLVRISCDDPELFWLPVFLETDVQRAVWYPSSVATQDHEHYRLIKRWWAETCDNFAGMEFALHDFGGRGVTCGEQAEIGGAAHLVHFNGSDTIEGIIAANQYYSHSMAAFSVPASEHSIQCAWGPLRQDEYLEHVLSTYAKPGAIVSIVIDGYDTMREAYRLCTTFKNAIIQSGAKIVFRPDSGDAIANIKQLLLMQAQAFGTVTNAKGYMEIKHVGIIQGDGVNKTAINKILAAAEALGFAANNLVFGSGGALLQKLDRDTYGFAQKASAIHEYNRWTGIFKDPVTDSGKKSKSGILETYRSKMNGEYLALNAAGSIADEFEPIMRTIFRDGVIEVVDDLETIRKRARV